MDGPTERNKIREPGSRSKYTIGVKEWMEREAVQQPQDVVCHVPNSQWRDRRSRKKRHGTIVSDGFQRPSLVRVWKIPGDLME